MQYIYQKLEKAKPFNGRKSLAKHLKQRAEVINQLLNGCYKTLAGTK